jgi:hypothetical protein
MATNNVPLTLKERVNHTVRDNIESAKNMRDPRFDGCYDEGLNQFYLSWAEWTESDATILAVSPDRGVWFSPHDQFCPFCELEDVDVLFEGGYEKLSGLIHRLMTNSLLSAKRIEEAILDTWINYMTEICPQIFNAKPSLCSRSAGCRFDRPSVTPNTLIDHFLTHLMEPHNILLPYMLRDAKQRWDSAVSDNVLHGKLAPPEIMRSLGSMHSIEQAAVRKRVN